MKVIDNHSNGGSMEITDSHIKHATSSAMLDETIKACYQTIADMAKMEADCKAHRLKAEMYLGMMIAAKVKLESHSDL